MERGLMDSCRIISVYDIVLFSVWIGIVADMVREHRIV